MSEEETALERLSTIAGKLYDRLIRLDGKDYGGTGHPRFGPPPHTYDEIMGMVAKAVAAEVLRDPAHWAHALGLPEPVSQLSVATTTPPDACPACGTVYPHRDCMASTEQGASTTWWQCKVCAERADTAYVAGLG